MLRASFTEFSQIMSNFTPDYNKLTATEWRHRALERSTDNKSSFLPIGGLVLGILVASTTGFPPTGLLVFAWAVYEAFARNNRMGRNEIAITQYGCVAHCLAEDDFRDFCAQVGDEEALKQLHWAKSNSYRLSEIAEDYLDSRRPPQLIDQAPSVSFTQATPDLPGMLAKSMKNSLIIGVPGAGKGIFVSNALEAVKRSTHKVTVFYLDPKGDANESGYFSGRVDRLYRADVITQSPVEIYEWIVASLADFDSTPIDGIKLLVFDELTAIAGILKTVKGASQWLKSRITSYSSSGSSRGIILWGIAQNAHLANLGFDGGTRSIFIPVFLISADQVTASTDILRSGMIPEESKLDPDGIIRLCKQSEVNRAIFYGGLNEWFPAVRMENYSGFDRDSRKFLPGFAPPNQDKLASDFTTISQLEDAYRNDSPTATKSLSHLSESAQMILEYFDNVLKKEPKSIRDLKQSTRLRGISDMDLLSALHELVKAEELNFNIEGNYLKSDWW